MRAMVVMKGISLELQNLEKPKIRDDQVLIKIVACGLNRCDLMMKPPKSVYCPGHECSGTIIAIGRHVTQWNVGDKVCAILDEGGGYAEQVAVPAKYLLTIPTNVSLADAASLPFAACNIWLALFAAANHHHMEATADPGILSYLSCGWLGWCPPQPCTSVRPSMEEPCSKKILIHEGASKIGSMAIQFAKYFGMKVIATAESRKHLCICEDLGADFCFDHKTQDLVDTVMKEIRGIMHGIYLFNLPQLLLNIY